MSKELGMSVKRDEDFSQWYLDVVRKGGFMDQRTPVKGFDVILPWGYSVWELIQKKFDSLLKERGIQNAYFPMLIPEKLIKKEKKHLEGFSAEEIVVTEAGGSPLAERLILRPTSETIIYSMFSLWIRSYQDLPFRINQWCNITRWDSKITKPFIRGREFLWQEGHTAHATREEAVKQADEAVQMYKSVYADMAVEPFILVRPKSDTFGGAEYSIVFDTVVQDGRVVQGPDSHLLGQNFSVPFDVKFTDRDGTQKFVWQTSWGLSTRQVGIIIMHHGDDSGAILPPALAPLQCVIVPILFKGKENEVLSACRQVESALRSTGIRCDVDNRDYSPGFKFNEWELKGVPLRIEIGPNDVSSSQLTVVNRLTGERSSIGLSSLDKVQGLLDSVQSALLEKSRQFLRRNVRDAASLKDIRKDEGGFFRAPWCSSAECEKSIKDETGCEIRGTLYEKHEKPSGSCIYCGKKADQIVYIAAAY